MRRAIVIMFLGAALVSCGGSISCTGTLEPESDDGAGGSPGIGGAPATGGFAGLGGQAGAGGLDAGAGGHGGGSGGAGGLPPPDSGFSDVACTGQNPAGCFFNGRGCPAGEVCAAVGCAPSACGCYDGAWRCTADCAGGTCVVAQDASDDVEDVRHDVEDAGCIGPNPAGCFHNGIGCRTGETCELVGCTSSYCFCTGGVWGCTKDCGGGSCVPVPEAGPDVIEQEAGPDVIEQEAASDVIDAGCVEPNPVGCLHSGIGCPAGQLCARVGCKPSACGCSNGHWICTDDCAGGSCVSLCEGQALAVSTMATGPACTAVVRLVHDDFSMIGWQLVCGPIHEIDQNLARSVAQHDTGYGNGHALSPVSAQDEHVFYSPPGDFGGVGVVSAKSGLSVFGGSIIWMGTGEITWPKAGWEAALESAPECALPGWPKWTGYDLVSGSSSQAEGFSKALKVVWETILPLGLSSETGAAPTAVVLLYPRSVGVFNPAVAEWIVLLNVLRPIL